MADLQPDEAAPPNERVHHHRPLDRRERILMVEGVLLAFVTIATAWAGYSAATWQRSRGSTWPERPRACGVEPGAGDG